MCLVGCLSQWRLRPPTAAIVTAISLAAVGATVAAVSMSTSVQTAAALNNLSANVAQALDVQSSINAQLKGGIMILNQRIGARADRYIVAIGSIGM